VKKRHKGPGKGDKRRGMEKKKGASGPASNSNKKWRSKPGRLRGGNIIAKLRLKKKARWNQQERNKMGKTHQTSVKSL